MPIHQPADRLLIIGFDGGTWDVFGPLCDLNEMPNLARLRNQGAWANLISPQPPLAPAAWATLLTGVNPGEHGILTGQQRPGDPARSLRGESTLVDAAHLGAAAFWDYASAAGRTVGIINAPLSYPLHPREGFAISGMFTPPGVSDWTHPRHLAAELTGYIIDLDYGLPARIQPESPADADVLPSHAAMLTDIMHMTERRGFHTLRLMQSQPWDMLMVVFNGVDRIFHHFWHYLQTDNPDHGSGLEIIVAEQLRDYFRLLDNIIGSLARSAGSQANVVFLSSHGFGAAANHWAHLNNWLLEIDLLRLKTASGSGWAQQIKRRAPWLRDIARRILPSEARDAVKIHGHLADAIDWSQTQAWVEPLYNNVAGIYLHRADRYADGVVSPAAVGVLTQQILVEAKRLHVPRTSRPLILDIRRREDIYPGPRNDSFPDLVMTLDPAHAVAASLGISLITPITRPLCTGDHRPEGMFLACGPNIRPGLLSLSPSLTDVAPTLLHIADAPIPATMQGQIITAAFTDGYMVLHPPRRGPGLPPPL